MKIMVSRRQRSSIWRTEWHNHDGHRWFHLSVGSPRVHRWWAFEVWVYL